MYSFKPVYNVSIHIRLVDFDSAVLSIRLCLEGMEKEKPSKLVNGNIHKEPILSRDRNPSEKRPQPLRVSHRLRDFNRKIRIKEIVVRKAMTVKEMKMEVKHCTQIEPLLFHN